MKTFILKTTLLASIFVLCFGTLLQNAEAYGSSNTRGGGSGDVGICGGLNTPAFSEISPEKNATLKSLDEVSFTVTGNSIDQESISVSVDGESLQLNIRSLSDNSFSVEADASGLNLNNGLVYISLSATGGRECIKTSTFFVELDGAGSLPQEPDESDDTGDDTTADDDDTGADDTGDFSSADQSHWAYSYALALVNRGVMTGDGETGELRLDDPIQRAELLVMVMRAFRVAVPSFVSEQPFNDTPIDEWFTPYVTKAKALGWIDGYENGTLFKPGASITRVEALKIILVVAGIDPVYTDTPFIDVPVGGWFAPYVSWAFDAGLVEGYGNNKNIFKPNLEITRGEIAKILVKLLDYLDL